MKNCGTGLQNRKSLQLIALLDVVKFLLRQQLWNSSESKQLRVKVPFGNKNLSYLCLINIKHSSALTVT